MNATIDDVKQIDAGLTRHGKRHELHSYDGAGHAFLNFTNATTYRERRAKDAGRSWSRS